MRAAIRGDGDVGRRTGGRSILRMRVLALGRSLISLSLVLPGLSSALHLGCFHPTPYQVLDYSCSPQRAYIDFASPRPISPTSHLISHLANEASHDFSSLLSTSIYLHGYCSANILFLCRPPGFRHGLRFLHRPKRLLLCLLPYKAFPRRISPLFPLGFLW